MLEEKEIYFENPDHDIKIEGKVYIIPPNPKLGYNCGFSLFIPKECQKDTTLLVHCCNTGGHGVTDGKLDSNKTCYHLDEANEAAKLSTIKLNYGMWIASDLNMPVLTPIIPRVVGYYTQALGSKVYHNDVSELIEDQKDRNNDDKLSIEEIDRIRTQCMNLPEQLVNMLKSAQIFLDTKGISIDDKVIIEGYSAGSKFANGFTALHPEVVKALVCGGNSGFGILPIKEIEGDTLNFPLGIGDVPDFDYDAFKSIPQLYYIGTDDYNDPAMYKCNFKKNIDGSYVRDEDGFLIPITDENGNIVPILDNNGKLLPRHKECYTQDEIIKIHTFLGSNPQTRFDNNTRMYNKLGINAVFKKFPGTHNSVTTNHNGSYVYTNECVKDFIKNILDREKSLNHNKHV